MAASCRASARRCGSRCVYDPRQRPAAVRLASWTTRCRAPTRCRSSTPNSARCRRPTHPLGIRPAGEGGTTPALGVVVNAIVDALATVRRDACRDAGDAGTSLARDPGRACRLNNAPTRCWSSAAWRNPGARPGADPRGKGVQRRAAGGQGRRPLLAADTPLEVRGQDHPWVSRGGLKLAHALEHFGLSPEGRVCLDIGASTGGFTDVLLAHGAARVHAVDVGHGQLAWKLRSDPRVVVHERTNARHLTRRTIGEPIGALVCDASFIGLATAAAGAAGAVRAGRLGGGADQAAVRGRAGRWSAARAWCAIRRCTRRSARGSATWWAGAARLARAGHRGEPDHRPGGQPRVPDRGGAREWSGGDVVIVMAGEGGLIQSTSRRRGRDKPGGITSPALRGWAAKRTDARSGATRVRGGSSRCFAMSRPSPGSLRSPRRSASRPNPASGRGEDARPRRCGLGRCPPRRGTEGQRLLLHRPFALAQPRHVILQEHGVIVHRLVLPDSSRHSRGNPSGALHTPSTSGSRRGTGRSCSPA